VHEYLRSPLVDSPHKRIRSALIAIYNYIIEANPDSLSLSDDDRELMWKTMKDVHTRGVSTFRERLERCPHGRRFSSHDENDAGEFASYLFNLLGLKNCSITKSTYFSNDRTNWYTGTRNVDAKSIPIIEVVPHVLESEGADGPIRIDKFLSIKTMDTLERPYKGDNGVHYVHKLDHTRLDHADFVVFNIIRLGYDGRLNLTPVHPTRTIQNLELRSIVVYEAHHYSTYVYVDEVWYYYDDLKPEFVHVGSYTSLLSSKPSPLSAGTLYWYG